MSDVDHDSDVARVLDESEGCFAIVPDQEITKSKRSYDSTHPSIARRSRQATLLLFFVILFFLLDRRAEIKQVRGVVSVVGADRCGRFPASVTINMVCTQQTRTADVAKTSDCVPSMVTQARAVVAHASRMSDNNFMHAIGKEFERNPLHVRGFFGGRRDARDVDAELHSVHRLVFLHDRIGKYWFGVIAAFWFGSSAICTARRCHCWVTTLRCCWWAFTRWTKSSRLRCWVEVRVAVVRPFRFGRPWRE